MTRTWNSKGYKRFGIEEAKEYASIATEIFAPIYPVIARQILQRCNAHEGYCIDLGSGAAHLAVAMAKATSLEVCAMDFSALILQIARENIAREGLSKRVRVLAGDVHKMPFRDNSVALVVSRGSMRFWRNKPAALREIGRVLEHGGKGFIGGGAGSAELSAEIGRKMAKLDPKWEKRPIRKSGKKDAARWEEILKGAGFSQYDIVNDESGFWLCFEKP